MTAKHQKIAISAISIPILVLSGCSQNNFLNRDVTNSIDPALINAGYGYEIAYSRNLDDAFVSMPSEAGELISVIQTDYGNGSHQRLVYRTGLGVSGENHIDVRAIKKKHFSKANNDKLKVYTNEIGNLRRSFAKEFPGRRFAVATLPDRNGYGNFGHSYFTYRNGQNCIYAWQNVESKPRKRTWVERFWIDDVTMSLRYRFCGYKMSETAALNVIKRMKITLDPNDMRNKQEYRWDGNQSDGLYDAQNTDPGEAAYISEPIAARDRELEQPITRKKVKPRKRKIVRKREETPKIEQKPVVYSDPVPLPEGEVEPLRVEPKPVLREEPKLEVRRQPVRKNEQAVVRLSEEVSVEKRKKPGTIRKISLAGDRKAEQTIRSQPNALDDTLIPLPD